MSEAEVGYTTRNKKDRPSERADTAPMGHVTSATAFIAPPLAFIDTVAVISGVIPEISIFIVELAKKESKSAALYQIFDTIHVYRALLLRRHPLSVVGYNPSTVALPPDKR